MTVARAGAALSLWDFSELNSGCGSTRACLTPLASHGTLLFPSKEGTMQVTIENVEETKQGFFGSKPVYKLYVTAKLNNEEQYVLEKNIFLSAFTIIEGMDDVPHKPKILAHQLFERKSGLFRRDPEMYSRGDRVCVFSHSEIDWVNYNEDLLRAGLKKWKEAIDAEAGYHQKRPDKSVLDL